MRMFDRRDGYYDARGQWRATKHCFRSCGARCTCTPPGGRSYAPEHDERLKPPIVPVVEDRDF